MKLVLLAAIAASSLATSAGSQTERNAPIVIKAPVQPEFGHWVQAVSNELDRHLVYPAAYPGWDYPEGTVAIGFSCTENGKPGAIALVRSSGNQLLDRAVMNAVARIKTLHPLPSQVALGTPIRANVIFAADQGSLARQQSALRREEARLAANERKTGRRVVVLELSHRPAG